MWVLAHSLDGLRTVRATWNSEQVGSRGGALTAPLGCVWLIFSPPPHPPPQVTQLKLDLGGLWWQAARAGLTPPDIDAALAAGACVRACLSR